MIIMGTPSSTPDLSMPGTAPPGEGDFWNAPGNITTSNALTDLECWALATTQPTGRIGFVRMGELDIFPVNHFVVGDHLYFRTSADGTIGTSFLNHAALQVDHVDRENRSGWTVLFNGPVARVEDSSLLTTLWGKAVDEPWAPGPRDQFLSLTPALVRGRRIGTAH
jgi:hypothetical protein